MEPDGMDPWKTIFLSNPVVLRFHVNFPGRTFMHFCLGQHQGLVVIETFFERS